MSMDEGSPGSREAEGEGGEGFYIAPRGRRPDLLVTLVGGDLHYSSIKQVAGK